MSYKMMLKVLCLFAWLGFVQGQKEPEGETNDVTVTCLNCERNNGGVVGGNLTLHYAFSQEFQSFTITYNLTHILVVQGSAKYKVNTDGFDDPRLFVSRTF